MIVDPELRRTISLQLSAYELADQLHQAAPEHYPAAADELKDKKLTLKAKSESFLQFLRELKKWIDL